MSDSRPISKAEYAFIMMKRYGGRADFDADGHVIIRTKAGKDVARMSVPTFHRLTLEHEAYFERKRKAAAGE